jgi:arginine:ornithine antiporter/lysine permease
MAASVAAMLYAPGIAVYVIARKENDEKTFTMAEAILAIALVGAGLAAAYLIWSGKISPLSS